MNTFLDGKTSGEGAQRKICSGHGLVNYLCDKKLNTLLVIRAENTRVLPSDTATRS